MLCFYLACGDKRLVDFLYIDTKIAAWGKLPNPIGQLFLANPTSAGHQFDEMAGYRHCAAFWSE